MFEFHLQSFIMLIIYTPRCVVSNIIGLLEASGIWLNSRVVGVDGASTGSSSLDGLHCCGVQGLLLGQGPLLITVTLGPFHLPLPLCLVHVVDPQQQTVVHDLKAFQHLNKGTRSKDGGKCALMHRSLMIHGDGGSVRDRQCQHGSKQDWCQQHVDKSRLNWTHKRTLINNR